MNGLQATYLSGDNNPQRADLNKPDFDKLVLEKGRKVIYEKALLCPCKSVGTNQQSNCKNCGGSGWIFVNPKETRMVMTGMDVATKIAPWSEEMRGFVAITALKEEELGYMDRVTEIDGEAIYSQVIHLKKKQTTWFAYTAYNVKEMIYAGLFRTIGENLQRLIEGTDYTIDGKNFILENSLVENGQTDISITLRYKHYPAFHILEMKRETMQSFKLIPGRGEEKQNFPISCYARRAHYQLDTNNLAGDRLLSNNFATDDCLKIDCNCNNNNASTEGNLYDFRVTQGDSWDYSLNILEDEVEIDITSRTYVMQVRDGQGNLIIELLLTNDRLIIVPPNILTLHLSIVETAALPVGVYNYDLEETNGSEVQTILSGKFIIALQISLP